jgi:uncharacterized membrane protein
MKKIGASILATLTTLLPVVALAQFGEITTFVGKISTFINSTLIPLVFGIALLMFIWGVFKTLILGGSDAEKREEGQQLMMWAIIGFVVMVSVWGIVNMIANGLGFSSNDSIQNIPNVPTNNN